MLLLYSASLNPAFHCLQIHYISVFSIGRSIQISALSCLVDPLSELLGCSSCCRKSLEHWTQRLLEETA